MKDAIIKDALTEAADFLDACLDTVGSDELFDFITNNAEDVVERIRIAEKLVGSN